MKPHRISTFTFVTGLLLCGSGTMATESGSLQCWKAARFLAPVDSPDHRKYAPDRAVKISHLALDITPDFPRRRFVGSVVLQFQPNVEPLPELTLDAVDLAIRSVSSSEEIRSWTTTTNQVIIDFVQPIPLGKSASVTITYDAEPTKGIYFRTQEMGYPAGDTHLFSNGEPIEARHWYPCLDAPNAKYTTEVTCHVPAGMTAESNGRLVSTNRDAATGLTAFHWSQDKPHANYLISLSAGYFTRMEDHYKNVPLAYLTPPSESREAPAFFRHTKDIMGFFETETGIPYPWDKYDQICLQDFIWGGMENTSATLLTDGELFSAATENIIDGDSLVAHEMAHQWFGDLVTCKDWSDIWLNEGFATYYALLYEEHQNGHDAMLYGLYENAAGLISMSPDTVPIVRHTYGDPDEEFGQYGYLPYPKGGWVLHMLRSQLGKELYQRCIKTYVERHKFGNVVTEDLRRVIEELSGRSFDQFFDQWLYHAHNPELGASYEWNEQTRMAKITLRQNQKIDEQILLFNFPLTIRFKGKFGTVDRTIQVREKYSEFSFALPSVPEIVRLDPDYTLLAKITFKLPTPMVYAQLADRSDLVGRLLAVEELRDRKDQETVAKLATSLKEDPCYGVRTRAAQALRGIHTPEALQALLSATNQPDARVRLQVASALGGFYHDSARIAAGAMLEREKNPAILAAALRSLGDYNAPEVPVLLTKYLQSDSFRNELADAAISAIQSQDDPAYINPLLATLRERERAFRTGGFVSGLHTVAYLARNEEKKDAVRDFLVSYVNHKNQTIATAALEALGTLGDPRAIAVLQNFASARNGPEKAAAAQSLSTLRSARKPVDDFKNLRQEVLDLEKANRELRQDLEEIKKQLPVKTNAPTKASPKPKPAR